MVIHIFPDNYGSLVLRKMMREAGCNKKVIIGGWSSSTYGSRVDIKGGVILPSVRVYYRAITLRGASLPTADQDEFLESAKYMGCMDAVTKGDGPVGGDTVMDIGFSNVNPVLHCPGTILGVGVMENFGVIFGEDKYKYSIYSHAYCPPYQKCSMPFIKKSAPLLKLWVSVFSTMKRSTFSQGRIFSDKSTWAPIM